MMVKGAMLCFALFIGKKNFSMMQSYSRVNKHWPIGEDQRVWCVASTLTFGNRCGHCFGIRSTIDLCRFCVLSLHREVGGVTKYTR